LRHQFAPKRHGEDGLVKMIDQLAGAGRFGGESVDPQIGDINQPPILLKREN
jgi:hypothetical protein